MNIKGSIVDILLNLIGDWNHLMFPSLTHQKPAVFGTANIDAYWDYTQLPHVVWPS